MFVSQRLLSIGVNRNVCDLPWGDVVTAVTGGINACRKHQLWPGN